MADGYEPHDTVLVWVLPAVHGDHAREYRGAVGGVPGVVRMRVGWEGVLPVPRPRPSQDPYLVIFQRLGPTHGPVKPYI